MNTFVSCLTNERTYIRDAISLFVCRPLTMHKHTYIYEYGNTFKRLFINKRLTADAVEANKLLTKIGG